MKRFITISLFAVLFIFTASAQTIIAAHDAAKNIGKTVTINDKMFDGKVTSDDRTILYFGENYPNQQFTIVINAADKSKFKGRPEVDYRGKEFKVTGKLVRYEGKPAVYINDPAHLKVVLIDNSHGVPFKQH